MHVTLAGFVLFLHITVAIAAFMMAAVMHASFQALGRVRTVQEMRSWASAVHRLDPLFPLAALLLLGLGAWLLHLTEFNWGTGWVIVAVTTLVVVEGASGALLAPRAKLLVATIEATPDGPVSDDLRRAATDRVVWHLGHIATVGFLGVVFLMAAKPATGWAVVIVVVAAALGVALSELQLRSLPTTPTGDVPAQRVADTAKTTDQVRTSS